MFFTANNDRISVQTDSKISMFSEQYAYDLQTVCLDEAILMSTHNIHFIIK